MSIFELTGRVALITGSSRGIGKASAQIMAAQGAKVVISSRNQESCDATAKEINDAYGEGTAIAVAANISSKEALQNLVDQTHKQLGKIDILVCNAASNPYHGPMSGISDEQFQKILQNNIISNNWLIQMVAPEMQERKKGSIVIISSIGGILASTTIGAYNISKAADFQLARNLAAEFGADGVRVNCIAPGIIKTDFAQALTDNPKIAKVIQNATPLRRFGEPEEIGGAVAFLASDASNYMTGQSITIDGGTTVTGPL